MAKHASPAKHLQVVESPGAVAVHLPLPVLGALTSARGGLMDLFVGVGRQSGRRIPMRRLRARGAEGEL